MHVPELQRAPAAAFAAARTRGPSTISLWVSDYEQPSPAPEFNPNAPAPTAGHVRVRLDLIAIKGQAFAAGTVLPAAASADATHRALAIIETHDRAHGQYFNVTGDVKLTAVTPDHACGTFDIGDGDERASGTFSVRFPD